MEISKIVNISFLCLMVVLVVVGVWLAVSKKDIDYKGGDR